MEPPPVDRIPDPLLEPFLRDLDDDEWQRLSAQLVRDHLEPILRGVVRRRLGSFAGGGLPDAEAEDVRSEALARLLARLRHLRSEEPIVDLRGYAATTAGNACDDHLRRKYPQRARLKNRVRYALKHRAQFILFRLPSGDWHAGLAAGPGRPTPVDAARLQRLRQDSRSVAGALGIHLSGRDVVGVLAALLDWIGHPVEIDELVGALADLWGVQDDAAPTASTGETADGIERLPDPRPSVAAELADRTLLERLWTEVGQLPLRQRSALLLNLRDARGEGILELLPATGVATLKDIAGALEMPPEALAALWNDLPLQDEAIGHRLGLARQQVINLRKAARARLARRMGRESDRW